MYAWKSQLCKYQMTCTEMWEHKTFFDVSAVKLPNLVKIIQKENKLQIFIVDHVESEKSLKKLFFSSVFFGVYLFSRGVSRSVKIGE